MMINTSNTKEELFVLNYVELRNCGTIDRNFV